MAPIPTEPVPSRFQLPDPRLAGPEDVVAVGGDLSPGTILAGYRQGLFPMHTTDGLLGWWSPWERAILPLDALRVSRSLRRSFKKYRMTVDRDPLAVMEGCADPTRPNAWITNEIMDAYLQLFRLGWVHSVEAWDDAGRLAGGLYGVGIGGLFAGESMFSRQRDSSKCALVHLVGILAPVEGAVLDVQWPTPHLVSLGAVAIGRQRYLGLLPTALAASSPWEAAALLRPGAV
ncbi:MAG: leucyl/phenylalanyl-tRNA--protein transferase [Actinomycetota bacterium]